MVAPHAPLRHTVSVSPTVRVERVLSNEDLRKAFSIRMRVFVREQGVPANIELDGDDKKAIHLLARAGTRAVGTARIVVGRYGAKIGRMAVLKTYRRRGIGSKLLKRAIAIAARRHAKPIFLHAQVPVIRFYERLGFRCVGRRFHEAGIPHRKMILGD
jgi:predicted GNAT family N-acyltransferase